MTSSLTSVSPYLSKPFEELKDDFNRSDLDDQCNSDKKFQSQNMENHTLQVDSKGVILKSQHSNTSPLASIFSTFSSIIPIRINHKKEAEIYENERNVSVEKKKVISVFCCLPRSVSNVSP